jgi:hypothetical protein
MRDGVFFLRSFAVVTTPLCDPSWLDLTLGSAIVMDRKVDWAWMFTPVKLGQGSP